MLVKNIRVYSYIRPDTGKKIGQQKLLIDRKAIRHIKEQKKKALIGFLSGTVVGILCMVLAFQKLSAGVGLTTACVLSVAVILLIATVFTVVATFPSDKRFKKTYRDELEKWKEQQLAYSSSRYCFDSLTYQRAKEVHVKDKILYVEMSASYEGTTGYLGQTRPFPCVETAHDEDEEPYIACFDDSIVVALRQA